MEHYQPSQWRKGNFRHPSLVPITQAPEWAGDLGEKVLRRTQDQTKLGIEDPQFANCDPLAVLNDWFGAGNPRAKNPHEPSLEDFDDRRVRVFRPSWGKRRLHIDRALAQRDVVTVSYSVDGVRTETVNSFEFDHSLLRSVRPMRDFARRLTQTNKPVAAWLHTVGHHVGTESLHERTFAMLCDYHPAVDYIAGQPFTLVWPAGSELESHTPDFLVLGKEGFPLIVDVRSTIGASEPKWVKKIPVIRDAVQSLGMGYIEWTGMSRPYRMNLENFTEARVPPESYALWAPVVLQLCDEPTRASDLADHLQGNGYPRLHALMLIRRMLWRRALRTNMFQYYRASSLVERADAIE